MTCYNFPVKYVLLPLAFLLISCNAHEGMQEITLQSQDNEFSVWVEIADDLAEQAVGLMNRETLSDGKGMLFIFSQPKKQSFWMKNTLIPLDILFFDAEGAFVNGHTMDPCDDDPCKSYGSARAIQYALEVNAGVTKKHNIGLGWSLVLPIAVPE